MLFRSDRIAAVEAPGALRSDNEIDAKGKVVAPGFIDVHTHDDTALIDNPTMAMKASQGVTTVVCGNCGVSASPYLRSDIGHFLSLIVKKQANVSKSFAEFAGKVDATKPAINGAFLIGHGTLRLNAMGDDIGRTTGRKRNDHLDRRRRIVRHALRMGRPYAHGEGCRQQNRPHRRHSGLQ